MIPLADIDPDLNLYNLSNTNSHSYTPNEFNIKFNEHNGLSILHLNARSLQKNFEKNSEFISTIQISFSIIAVSEIWITDVPLLPFETEGYTFLNSNRLFGRGGGVAFFVLNQLKYRVRSDIIDDENDITDYEFMFIDIFNHCNIKTTIGVIYRKPSGNIDDFLQFYDYTLCKLKCENCKLYITGDFNIDILKHLSNSDAAKFVSINSSYGLIPLIKSPTRITANTASLIDNIFTNVINSTLDSGSFCVDISDHLPVFYLSEVECNINRVLKTQTLSRKITDDGIHALIEELYITDWSSIYCCPDVNDSYDLFLSKLLDAFHKHQPYTK